MCVTAIIAATALIASAIGTVATIKTNNAQAKYQAYQAKEQKRLLQADTELAKIASYEKENMRAREFSRTWSSSLAAIGATGMAEHISFFQGVGPQSEVDFANDVRAMRLGLANDNDRSNTQIGVIGYGARVAKFNASMGNVGALAGFAQDAMSAATFYNSNKAPAKKG